MSASDLPAEPASDVAGDGTAPLTARGSESSPAAAQVPAMADGVARRLDPRLVPLDRIVLSITSAIMAFMLLLAAGILMFMLPVPGAPVLVLAATVAAIAGLAWWSYRWPALAYRHASLRVDVQGIEIRRGVVWRNVIAVPRSRVQHIDVSQGPLERLFGLGTMRIYTAGTDYAKVDVRGLEHGLALRIRDHLLPEGTGDAV